ncbi:MAG: glycosyltransferase family 4 protein [Candidatus Omnitrophica bacterium]|nr:glycosyltransferase family 4 protein [Candidatus Omnitrophota bacterium]
MINTAVVNKRISLAHIVGNPFIHNAALSLAESRMLHQVITTFGYCSDGATDYFLSTLPGKASSFISSKISSRGWPAALSSNMRFHWKSQILNLAVSQAVGNPYLSSILSNNGQLCFDRHVARCHLSGIDAIYAYEDQAALTFQAAKKRGIFCLYDLPILFYRTSYAIQKEEAIRFPQLVSKKFLRVINSPLWKIERKEIEISLADHIFAASTATKKSLLEAGIEEKRVTIVLYGAPVNYLLPLPKKDKVFRAIFVGQIGLRKGVHYLLLAWEELGLSGAELLLIGSNDFPKGWFSRQKKNCRWVGHVPHILLNQYYSQADVFVFPSLVEGFGQVILEAMACGLPVITTPNTAGPDIITEGIDGFIVPIRDVSALKEKIRWCRTHPGELARMGKAARRKAESLDWNLYRVRLTSKVQELLNTK